jgi:hypothetical protein
MDREHAAFICSHVFKRERPVLLVSRAGGDWQFLCGDVHSDEAGHVVGANHLFDRDPRLRELLDLPVDWFAERSSVDAPWVRSTSQPE